MYQPNFLPLGLWLVRQDEQLTEYLEDSTRAKLEIDQYKRENERLKKEIDILRQNIGREP